MSLPKARNCEGCGQQFQPVDYRTRFCAIDCGKSTDLSREERQALEQIVARTGGDTRVWISGRPWSLTNQLRHLATRHFISIDRHGPSVAVQLTPGGLREASLPGGHS